MIEKRFLKDCSCSYLFAVNTKESRELLMERWGRQPKNISEAEGCKCCGGILLVKKQLNE